MDKLAYLRQVSIFGMLEPKHLSLVAEMTHRRHYRKEQIIFYRGDPGDAMYILLTGSAKMTLPSETGSDVFVALLRAGDHFGELAVLDGRPRYVTVIAAEATELLAIYRDNLLAFMREHAEVSLQVSICLCLRLRHITELLADMAFLGLLPRIAKRLCQLVGQDSGVAGQPLEVRVSQGALAEMVGASREAVNKQLARLREIGLIKTERGRVRILQLDRLRAMAFASVNEFTQQT
jgi:CRP/FNR family transcriptional regulator, cyclic AMP receptor protein